MGSSFKFTWTLFVLTFVALVSGSSVLAQGTVLADTGFRPGQNGFSFENYGNESNPVNLTPASMQNIFGDRVCKAVTADGCVLTATAQGWMNKINQDMAGGHCEGMAALSKLIYTGQVNIKDLDPNATSIADLKPDNPKVQEEIARWFATQYVPPTASQEIRDQTPNQVIDTLVDQLKEGSGPFTMGIYAADGNGGHAITPYSVVDMGDGKVRVMVYDNNYPGQERFIEVDRNSNTWKYTGTTNPDEPVSEYSGTADSFSLTLTPATARTTKPQECIFCKADDGGIGTEANPGNPEVAVATDAPETEGSTEGSVETAATDEPSEASSETGGGNDCDEALVTTGPNTDITVTTESGVKASFINGHFSTNSDEITYYRPRSQTGLDGDTPGVMLSLPSDLGRMSVAIRGSEGSSDGGSDVTMLNCGQYQQVEGLSQADGNPDTILFDPETGTASVEVDPDESLTLEGAYDNPEGNDQTYTLDNVASEEGSVVLFGADPETGEFAFGSSGETTFDAQFSAIDPDGEVYENEYPEISSAGGESLSIGLDDVIDDPELDFDVTEVDPAFFDDYFSESDANIAGFDEEFIDEDGDGIDDITGEEIPADEEFIDEDGDGIDDVTGEEIPADEEFIDEDGDGIDDITGEEIPADEEFIDEDGDGIDDVTGEEIPADEEFIDEDGDGIDDITGEEIPADEEFIDEDGDGIDDVTGEEISDASSEDSVGDEESGGEDDTSGQEDTGGEDDTGGEEGE